MFFFFLIVSLSQIFNIFSLNACDFQTVFSDITVDSCYVIHEEYNEYWQYIETNCIPSCKEISDGNGPPCVKTYWDINGEQRLLFRPSCDKEGNYLPKQCKGQPTTGRCFCSDPEGKRLDGQQWWNKAQSMTCNCSRKKFDLRNSGKYYFTSLHCDSQGNYEPLQCDFINNLCWCADPLSGKVNSVIVPLKARNLLHCYELDSEYLRQCESQEYAQSRILHEFALHGTKKIRYNLLKCDEDGTYGSFRVTNGIAFCTWKDNINIASYQSAGTNTSLLTCNCARDTVIYEKDGKEQTEMCEGNGNYKIFQVEEKAFCVDDDGYPFISRVPDDEATCISWIP